MPQYRLGNPSLKVGSSPPAVLPGHLAHGFQEAGDGSFAGDIQAEGSWKFIGAGVGGPQSHIGWPLQESSHRNGQERKQEHGAQIAQKPAEALTIANLIDKKAQGHEDAGKKANVIIAGYGEKQGDCIEKKAPLAQEADHAQDDQREQGEGIQPHNVPLIPQSPGAQRIGAGKEHRGPIPPMEDPIQKHAKNSPARPSFTGTSIEKNPSSIPSGTSTESKFKGEAR